MNSFCVQLYFTSSMQLSFWSWYRGSNNSLENWCTSWAPNRVGLKFWSDQTCWFETKLNGTCQSVKLQILQLKYHSSTKVLPNPRQISKGKFWPWDSLLIGWPLSSQSVKLTFTVAIKAWVSTSSPVWTKSKLKTGSQTHREPKSLLFGQLLCEICSDSEIEL